MSANSKAQQQMLNAAKALHKLAGPARWQLQAVLGETAVAQASLGVRYGRDPYGNTWAPLTSRSGRPLRRTGNNIQRGWNARAVNSDTFVFGSRFKYLKTHQYGAIIRPLHAKALRFWVEGATAAFHIRGESQGIIKRGKNKGKERLGKILIRKGEATQYNLIFAQKVTIPQRQMIPEMSTGGLGRRWTNAFSRTIKTWLIRTTNFDI
jgi:phage gpG-like protein